MSDSETDADNEHDRDGEECDDDDEDDVDHRHKYRKKNSRRSVNQVSYKEESEDDTDSDDLIEVNSYDDSKTNQEIDDKEEQGEVIERILEHRFGRIDATGPKTASYQVEELGDPNDSLREDEEKEIQFLIKWKGWSHIHCTWESKKSLEDQKAKGFKKIELYLKKDEEIKSWSVCTISIESVI